MSVSAGPAATGSAGSLGLGKLVGAEVTDGFGQLCVRRLLRRQPGQPLAGGLRQALAGLHECLRDLTGHSGHAAGHTSDRAERGGQHLRQLTRTLPGLARFRGSRLGQLSLRRRGGTVADRRRTGARGNGTPPAPAPPAGTWGVAGALGDVLISVTPA